MELTPRQKDAVRAERSVAVTAGAGTGKTAMLAERFLHHVVVDGMSPLEIAAVTFTEKAAAELRFRIRETLLVNAGEDRASEADAAQISTIHSLAGRICRDFYDRVGIPADFRVLDETDAEIVLAAWFDEAMGEIEPDVVTGLGYSWLILALRDLFKDPPAALDALTFDEKSLREYIDRACEDAVADLIDSECWERAAALLEQFTGDNNDPVEVRRQKAISAMADILNRCDIDDALKVLKGLATNHGTAQRWPNGGLLEVRGGLIELRDAFKKCAESRSVQFGPADSEMCRRIVLLRKAFSGALEYLQTAKKEHRHLDFADLEHYAQEILKADDVRAHYAKRWKAILVDEFQDTNPVQEKILHALEEGGARLTIVGDGKQSIYGFRRADPRVFARFRESIGNDVILDTTFRTHAELVRPMNDIFSSLLSSEHQPLAADRSQLPHDAPFIECHSFVDDDSSIDQLRNVEGSFIASEIAGILRNGLTVWDPRIKEHRPARPADIAILSRTRKPLEIYIEKLLDAGIPAVNVGGGDLFDTPTAKDMSVLLRFAADPADDIALVALLRGPFFAVSDKALYELSRNRSGDESWWQLITKEHREIEREFRTLSEIYSKSRSLSAEQLLELADQLTGYTAVIANLEQSERRMADRAGFISLIRKFAALGRSDVIGADRYLKELLAAEAKIPRPPLAPGNAVSLMTIHAAKGLEWPIVFIPNLSAAKRSDTSSIAFDAEIGAGFKVIVQGTDGSYQREEPSILKLIRKKKKAGEDSESARILYVALTRAQDRLYLTSAGKESNDLTNLIPGLELAAVQVQRHGPVEVEPRVSSPLSENIASRPEITQQLQAVAPRLASVPASGLIDYAICPRRFKYRFIDGHPGVGQGPAVDAARIGTLTHLALELKLRTVEDLRPLSDGASDELLIESMRLAENFYSADDFMEFRAGLPKSEVTKNLKIGDLDISCTVDRVGEDYVLDYKTDSEIVPEHHAIQLWSYAIAMNKKRAVVAYLRQQKKYEYKLDELDHARTLAEAAVNGIAADNFVSTPTETGCRQCSYCAICDERHSN